MHACAIRRRPVVAAAIGFALLAAGRRTRAAPQAVVVFAAASLADVLRALATRWMADEPGLELRFSFAASSTLARQIEQGAPAHLFVSADERWMDHLARRGEVDAASRVVIAGNRLVVVRAGTAPAVAPEPAEDRAAIEAALAASGAAPGSSAATLRVATGDPAHVPAGRYAEAALRTLGLWDAVQPRLVRADSVRTALAFVERGEAGSGIVYATDARVSRRVTVAARFPVSSHPPIRYPAARVTGAPQAASGVLARLAEPASRALLRAAGFTDP